MRWHDASTSYPQVNHNVILCLSDGTISTGYLAKRRPKIEWEIHDPQSFNLIVKYWMPLPEIPEELNEIHNLS